jgi:cytoskeleton protein RodZ
MTDAGATTGPRLKAERERRGLSSQKAADELHLDGWIIDALEAEDYLRIGPSVYAKGHLKRYAALLGLPAAEIMAGYESRAQAPKAPPSQPATVRLRTDAQAAGNWPWPQIASAVVLGLLIGGLFWWKPWHQHGTGPARAETSEVNPNAATADSAAPAAGAAAASTAELPSTPADSPSAAATATAATAMTRATLATPLASASPPATAAQAASPEADAAAGAGRARLRLSFSADSWVDVHDAAGRRAFAGNGRANSVKTIAGIAPMRVYLGFASGVQLEINNRAVAIGPQFLAGDVAHFEAGADGVLRRDSHSVSAPGTAAPAQTRNARPNG